MFYKKQLIACISFIKQKNQIYYLNRYATNILVVGGFSKLLKHFHLSSEGLDPMMAVLLKRGKIQKTINQRGKRLPPEIYYSWTETAQIPTLTVV